MILDWTTLAAISVVLSATVGLVRWINSAFATRDKKIVELEKHVAVLQASDAALNNALVAAEGRTVVAVEGMRSDVKHMSERLDNLFELLTKDRGN